MKKSNKIAFLTELAELLEKYDADIDAYMDNTAKGIYLEVGINRGSVLCDYFELPKWIDSLDVKDYIKEIIS